MTKQERFLLFKFIDEVTDLMGNMYDRSRGFGDCRLDPIRSELYPWREGNEVNRIDDPTLSKEFCSWRHQKDPDPQVKSPTGDCEPAFGGYTTEEYLESLASLDRLQKKLGL